MPEMRQDITTGKWSVIATERAKRPEMPEVKKNKVKMPEYDEKCFFCWGNEQTTPPEVYAIRPDKAPSDSSGWLVRVVENKFAAVNLNNNFMVASYAGLYPVSHACGVAEVVIETPDHSRQMSFQTLEEIERVIMAFKDRYQELSKNREIKYIQIFKNCGAIAGASLAHPHSQIIAIPVVPAEIENELNVAKAYYQNTNRCVYCDIVEKELATKERIVYEDEYFLTIIPYAARKPYEMKIIPRRHAVSFGLIKPEEIMALARALKASIYRLDFALDNPPYNWYIHTAPVGADIDTCYHWHIEILPKLSIDAGFELSTGMNINITVPEDCADFLRNIDVDL